MNKANMQNIEEDMLPAQNTKTDSTVSIPASQDHPVSTKTISNPIEVNQSNQNTARVKVATNPIPKRQPVSIEKLQQNAKAKPVKVSAEKEEKLNKATPKAVMPKQGRGALWAREINSSTQYGFIKQNVCQAKNKKQLKTT